MKKIIVIVVMMGLVFGLGASSLRADQPAEEEFKVGFVNIRDVIERSDEYKLMMISLATMHEKAQGELDGMKRRLSQMNEEWEMEREGPKKDSLKQKMEQMVSDIKAFGEQTNRKLVTAKVTKSAQIYLRVHEVVQKYADLNEYTIILKVEKTDPAALDSATSRELGHKIETRSVLYYNQDLEVTDDILLEVNKKSVPEEKKEDK